MRRETLSAWPLRAKVAAVVALPLALAMFFGALRVQSELASAADLSAAADNARIVDPILRLDALVGADAVAGTTLDGAAFDNAVETVRSTVEATIGTESTVRTQLDEAIATAVGLRDRLAAGFVPPIERADAAGAVTTGLAAVVGTALDVENSEVRSAIDGVTVAMAGRRAAETQQLLVSILEPDVLALANRTAGRESADIDALAALVGNDATTVVDLRGELDSRIRMYGAAASGAPTNPFLSAGRSAERYTEALDEFSESLGTTLSAAALDRRSVALRDAAVVLGAVLTALVLALLVARSLVQPIRRLRLGALSVAHRELPSEIEQIRSGGHTPEISPVPVHTSEEIGQLARAVDAIHEEALQLAGEQARLRVQVGNMFETLSRRSRSLVDQQLALIEELERDEDDPRRLDSLFRLDHLATRMRRNGANLMVLAGTQSRRPHSDQPVALDAVMSAAVSEVEDYRRVRMLDVPDAALTAASAGDVVHLVAELIDNALRYSPPDSAVAVTAARAVEGGILLEVADRGLGMPPADLEETNNRLAVGGEVTPETARRMGLFVVGRLAQRHGVTVRLRATQVHGASSGVTVSMHIPVALVVTSFPTTERHARPPRRESSPILGSVPPSQEKSIQSTPGSGESAVERTAPVSLVSGGHNGATTDHQVGKLPRRRPGASGVDEQTSLSTASGEAPERRVNGSPSNTAAFFGARPAAHAARAESESAEASIPPPDPLAPPPQTMPIYQRMVSEWLVDPATGQGRSRSWTTPADSGWAAARNATDNEVGQRTDAGLPARRPGARLVPGAVDQRPPTNGSVGLSPQDRIPTRSPEAVRDKLTSHFTGVRTGRAEDVSGRHRTEEDE
ncbi:sensor histidine kinase [Rhodococcoides kyotonense]|uniref:sensor histidine kinase n=1 Tax=Rhodococcoides kyotonense TaxID=398843 RepID=UPI001FEC4AEE|nr:ATP-binding protein [Rhodococcus kyotonensis]